jgi:hypothetical protein
MTTSFRMVLSLRLLIEENVNLVILSCDYYSKGASDESVGRPGDEKPRLPWRGKFGRRGEGAMICPAHMPPIVILPP